MAATMKRPRTAEEMLMAEKAALADPYSIRSDAVGMPKLGQGYKSIEPALKPRPLFQAGNAGDGMTGYTLNRRLQADPSGGYTITADPPDSGVRTEQPKPKPDPAGAAVDQWANRINRPGALVREPGVAPLITNPSEYGPPAPPLPPSMRITGGLTGSEPKFGVGAQDIPDVASTLPAVGVGDRAAEAIASGAKQAVNTLATAFNPMIRKDTGGWFSGRWNGQPIFRTPGETPLVTDPSEMGPPAPPSAGGASFGGMGDVRAAEGAAGNSNPVTGHSTASMPNDDHNIALMRQRSAQLLRDMYAKGTTPEQHAALARDRAEIEANLDYYRKGLAPRTAPAALSPEQIAASKASLDSQAAGGDATFQGPIQAADSGMVDRVNAARQGRFDSDTRRREAGLGAARQFGDAFATDIADRTALAEASMKANIAGEQARGAVAGAVTRSGGLTPEQQVAEATAQAEMARLNREKAAMEGNGGSTPESAAVAQKSRQAALARYGVGDEFQKSLDADLAAINGGMSDVYSGKVAGNMWGGAEGMSRAVDSLNTNVSILERMASTDPVVASQLAADVLNSLPMPDAQGGYFSNDAGGAIALGLPTMALPVNQRNRRMTSMGLTRARQRLLRIKG